MDNAVAALSAAMDGLTAGGAPETTDKPETTQKPENVPQTGDSAQLMVYVAALAGSVSLLTGAAYVTRKRRS